MNEDVKELKYGATRCYLIENKLMVDTDWAGTLQAFFQCIKKQSIDLGGIEYLFITHYHPDQMGIAQDIAELGIKIIVMDEQMKYIHASDEALLRSKSASFKPIDENNIIRLSCRDSRKFLADIGIHGDILYTPGHTDDSMSLVLDSGVAFVGDLYSLRYAATFDIERVNRSWNRILSKRIHTVHYSHDKDDSPVGINSIEDEKERLENRLRSQRNLPKR